MSKQKRRQISEEELLGAAPQPSLLKQAGRGIVSGISAVANVLDVPGSMVRDTVGGKNPFDQLLAPHRSDNRLTGRDLARQSGMAGRKDTWGNWGGGLATEIALDPLTYMTLGGSAVGKVGKAFKAAGVHGDEAARIYAKAMGKAPGTYGPRQARLGLTGDLLQKAEPEIYGRAKSTADRMGVDLAGNMAEPMGGLAKFWPTGSVLGTGAKAQKVAGFMDDVGDFIRHAKIPGTNVRPVGDVMNLFNKRALNATSRGQLQHAGKIIDSKEGVMAGVKQQVGKTVHAFKATGLADDAKSQVIREAFEFPDRAPPEIKPLADEWQSIWKTNKAEAQRVGAPWLGDIEEKMHFARQRPQISPTAQLKSMPDADLQKHLQELDDWVANNAPTHKMFNSVSSRAHMAKTELAGRGTPGYRPLSAAEQAQINVASKDRSRQYAPLRATEGIIEGPAAGSAPLSGYTPSSEARKAVTLGAKRGAASIEEMAKHADWLKQRAFTPYKPEQLGQELKQKFKGEMPDRYLTGKQFSAVKRHIESDPVLRMLGYEPTAETARMLFKGGVKHLGKVSTKPRSTWNDLGKWFDKMSPELLKNGVYGNYPVTDFLAQGISQSQAIQSAKLFGEYLADHAKGDLFTSAKEGVPLGSIVKQLKLRDGDQAGGVVKNFYDLIGGPNLAAMTPEDAAKAIHDFKNMKVAPQHAEFLINAHKGWDTPESVGGLLGLYDGWNNLLKFLFTSADPKFHGRNLPAGQFNAALAGQWTAKAIQAGLELLSGKPITGASELPILRQMAAQRGIQNLDDPSATKLFQELAYAHEVSGSAGTGIHAHASSQVGGSVKDILSEIPGEQPFSAKGLGQTLKGKPGQWNPKNWRVRGVAGAQETTIPWGKAGEQVGDAVEHMNRIPGFYALLSQGVDPAEAAKRVGEAQVRYQNRFYTKTEQQVMQRLMLFYKFFRGQVPFTLKMLMENPGGPLAVILRSVNRSRDDEELVPEWIKETASIPLAGTPLDSAAGDGTKRYVTGLGLPFEDPIQFASPSAQNVLMEGASRLNPLLKAPMEYMTGQSFFQKGGPHGGRALEDLDPVLGRTLANIGNITGLRESKAPVRYPGSGLAEHVLSNSPLSPFLTKARTLTDPRKGAGAKASNLLTGMKLTDVSPGAQDQELRRKLQRIEKQLGARTFVETYLPADVKAGMSPSEQAQAAQLMALKKLLQERSKARKNPPK